MHQDESFPALTSSLIILKPDIGGLLKAVSTNNSSIIEDALARYPDLPI